jgi:predicted RNA binding protein YcfA (HicA-like mRNA interferase family)
MPAFGPVRRTELVRCLRQLGFTGPYAGGKHQFMLRGDKTLTLPNPHQADIGRELLVCILRQGGISRDDWEAL